MEIYIPDYLKEPEEKRSRLWGKILSTKNEKEKKRLGKEIQRLKEEHKQGSKMQSQGEQKGANNNEKNNTNKIQVQEQTGRRKPTEKSIGLNRTEGLRNGESVHTNSLRQPARNDT